ncbi:MAG: hypothetical protein RIQ79_2689 [Verrucomicrobiota bacterium]|jgi:hypothetical protein
MTSDQPSRAKPTLEDLLRVKKAERPDAAFWQDFERGMHKKQLAAIIEPKPWWLGLSILSRKFGPLGIPVSAGAAAMLALVVMRVSPVGSLAQLGSSSTPEPVAEQVSPAAAFAPSPATATVGAALPPVYASLPSSPAKAPAVSLAERSLTSNPAKSALVATFASAQPKSAYPATNDSPGRALTPSTPSAAAFATTAHVASKQSSGSAAPASEQALAEANSAAFALAAEDYPSDKAELNQRQARLLSNATELEEGKSLVNVRERVLHRLADDEARYASISRVGVNADRLSLKF